MNNKATPRSKINLGALLYGKITSCLVHHTKSDEKITSSTENVYIMAIPLLMSPQNSLGMLPLLTIFDQTLLLDSDCTLCQMGFQSGASLVFADLPQSFIALVPAYASLTLAFTTRGSRSRQMMYGASSSHKMRTQCKASPQQMPPGQTLPNLTLLKRSLWEPLIKYQCIVQYINKMCKVKVAPGLESHLWLMMLAKLQIWVSRHV